MTKIVAKLVFLLLIGITVYVIQKDKKTKKFIPKKTNFEKVIEDNALLCRDIKPSDLNTITIKPLRLFAEKHIKKLYNNPQKIITFIVWDEFEKGIHSFLIMIRIDKETTRLFSVVCSIKLLTQYKIVDIFELTKERDQYIDDMLIPKFTDLITKEYKKEGISIDGINCFYSGQLYDAYIYKVDVYYGDKTEAVIVWDCDRNYSLFRGI